MDDLLGFWFAEATAAKWFRPEDQAAFDAELGQRFGHLIEDAEAGRLETWRQTPRGALALTIVCDQLPRNLRRGTPGAFALDARARAAAAGAIDAGFDRDMMITARLFFYLPFQHGETLDDQERSMALHETLGCPFYLTFARQHHVIIERFGRFPHRNAILGRVSTAAELAFLQEPNSSF